MSIIVGQSFAESAFTINRSSLLAYAQASGDHNPIHLDEAFAKSVGLPDVIAHGMYTMALAGEAVRLWLGNEKEIIDFSTRFTKPVVVPADVQVHILFSGQVNQVIDDVATIDVSAVCDGVKVLGQTKVRVRL
jgi:acyl dehydratase